MGLFGNSNDKILEEVLKNANVKPIKKMIQCPRCGKRMTVTFFNSRDSKICTCGYKIYCS